MTVAERLSEVQQSPRGRKVAAFFDVDGTLLYGYSGLIAAQERIRRREMAPTEALQMVAKGVEMGLGRADYADALAVLARAWRGRTEEELDEWGEQFFRSSLAKRVYPEARELVEAHKARGHTVVVASSATRFQVAALANDLGVRHVLCTPLVAEDGVLTGEVGEPDLWGQGKADAVASFAIANKIDLSASFAYADGDEDVALLGLVGHPRPTNPGRDLNSQAAKRGWPVTRFSGRGRINTEQVVRNLSGVGGLIAGMGFGLTVGLLNRRKRDATNIGISMGSDLMLGMLGVRINVIGEEHLFSHRPAVFIINHQSNLDGPVVMSIVRHDFTGVGKAELARNPVGKAFASLTDLVLIDRSNSKEAVASLGPLVQRVASQGLSILIAPEGTRSPTKTLGPFKKGAFRMAMAARLPIVPIVIRNTHDLQPKGSRICRPGVVDVVVHTPIRVADWTVDELEERIAEVRQLYLETLADWPEA
jgi:putative phosphoserine phosphatase/1-acylglycerol-3-phosphate O-acyltransferase